LSLSTITRTSRPAISAKALPTPSKRRQIASTSSSRLM
jgi:hypothetical protein